MAILSETKLNNIYNYGFICSTKIKVGKIESVKFVTLIV